MLVYGRLLYKCNDSIENTGYLNGITTSISEKGLNVSKTE